MKKTVDTLQVDFKARKKPHALKSVIIPIMAQMDTGFHAHERHDVTLTVSSTMLPSILHPELMELIHFNALKNKVRCWTRTQRDDADSQPTPAVTPNVMPLVALPPFIMFDCPGGAGGGGDSIMPDEFLMEEATPPTSILSIPVDEGEFVSELRQCAPPPPPLPECCTRAPSGAIKVNGAAVRAGEKLRMEIKDGKLSVIKME